MAKASKASSRKRSSKKASAKRSRPSTGRASANAATRTKKTAKTAAKKSARKPAKTAARKSAKKPSRKTATKKAAKTSTRKPAKKSTARKPAQKSSARQPAKTAAKRAARKPAKKTAAKRSTKPAARKPAKTAAFKKPARKAAARKPAKKSSKKTAIAATPTTWNAAPARFAGTINTTEPKKAPAAFRRTYKTWLSRLIGLRRRLLGETVQLEEEALKAAEGDVSIDHMADYGSDSYEQEFTLSLIESKSEALRDVDEAIRKIEDGTYGLCEECETLIPKLRLEVLPHTAMCIDCKSAEEIASGF